MGFPEKLREYLLKYAEDDPNLNFGADRLILKAGKPEYPESVFGYYLFGLSMVFLGVLLVIGFIVTDPVSVRVICIFIGQRKRFYPAFACKLSEISYLRLPLRNPH